MKWYTAPLKDSGPCQHLHHVSMETVSISAICKSILALIGDYNGAQFERLINGAQFGRLYNGTQFGRLRLKSSAVLIQKINSLDLGNYINVTLIQFYPGRPLRRTINI